MKDIKLRPRLRNFSSSESNIRLRFVYLIILRQQYPNVTTKNCDESYVIKRILYVEGKLGAHVPTLK